jgi:hypothetical protein
MNGKQPNKALSGSWCTDLEAMSEMGVRMVATSVALGAAIEAKDAAFRAGYEAGVQAMREAAMGTIQEGINANRVHLIPSRVRALAAPPIPLIPETISIGRRAGMSYKAATAVVAAYLAKLQPKPIQPIDPQVEALVRWRDECALDWSGEDLVFHVLHILNHMEVQEVPTEHAEGFAKYRSLDEDARFEVVNRLLGD